MIVCVEAADQRAVEKPTQEGEGGVPAHLCTRRVGAYSRTHHFVEDFVFPNQLFATPVKAAALPAMARRDQVQDGLAIIHVGRLPATLVHPHQHLAERHDQGGRVVCQLCGIETSRA